MRVLVVSDSHGMIGRLGNILMAAEAEGPLDAVIHLGDGYCDLDEFAQNGLPPRYQVAGNCDLGRDGQQEIITLSGARPVSTQAITQAGRPNGRREAGTGVGAAIRDDAGGAW